MAKIYVKNTDGTYIPQPSVLVSNLDIVQDKGDSLTSAMSQKAVTDELKSKQDTINDLDAIRQGAEKGSTALQSYTESDPVYTADKPNLALKSELDGKVDKEEGKGLSSNDYTDEEKAKLSELDASINGIQEIDISDFSSFTEYDVQILSNGNLTSAGSPKSLLIPVKGGRTYRIKGAVTGARSLYFSCFTDDNMVSGTTANVCPDFVGNNNKRSELGVDEEVVQTMPNDCRFLYVSKVISGITCHPQWIRSEGVDGMRQDVEKIAALKYNYMPLRECLEISLTIDSNTLKWVSRNASCYCIPITNANLVRLVGITPYNFTYAFLKSFDNTEGTSVDFCSGTSLTVISKNLDITRSIPSDCKFIYVLNKENGLDKLPKVEIDGYVINNGVIGEIEDLKSAVNGLYRSQIPAILNNIVKRIIKPYGWSCLKVTDFHGQFRSLDNAGALKKIYKSTSPIIVTGDIVANEPAINGVLNPEITTYIAKAQEYGCFHCVGQHEVGFTNEGVGMDGKLKSNCLTHQQVVDNFITPMLSIWGLSGVTTPYYFKDFTTEKVRLISLYQFNVPLTTDPLNSLKYKYDRATLWYGQEQIDWLISTLNSVPDGYNVIILMHEPDGAGIVDTTPEWSGVDAFGSENNILNGSPVFDIVNAYTSRTSLEHTYTPIDSVTYPVEDFTLTVSADFSNAKGTFACYLAGDGHADIMGKPKGYNQRYIMQTACCSQSYDSYVNNNLISDISNCIVDGYAFYFDSRELCIARIGQTSSFKMQDRRMINLPLDIS